MTKGKPYDFWNKNAMTYEVEHLEKKNDSLKAKIAELESENKDLNDLNRLLIKNHKKILKEGEPEKSVYLTKQLLNE